jgi:hypothetical protein
MPPVFLNGVRIPEELTSAFINALGPFNEICFHCGGSMVEIKSVKINSHSNPLFRVWCTTCGRYGDVGYDLPRPWYRNLVHNLEIRIQRIF